MIAPIQLPAIPLATADIVDQLGALKAVIAVLTEREATLKAKLDDRGKTEYEGTMYRATVSRTTRDKLDMDAVRAKLHPNFIRAHTTQTPVTTVRVVAKVRA